MTFTPKITRGRFTLSPFSSDQMLTVGNALNTSIKKRIQSGVNAKDEHAKPLKSATRKYVPYARQKIRRGLQPIRDWTFSGRLMRSMKVLSVSENKGQIGFTDAHADRVAHLNNQIDKMFGISPKDKEVLNRAVFDLLTGVSGQAKVIQFRRAA